MRLLSLNPRWIAIYRWDDANGTQHFNAYAPAESQRKPGGISFDCPVHTKHCAECHQLLPSSHRLAVWFENPVDGLPPEALAEYRWHRVGEDFESLTLTPSINAQVIDSGCWHGVIENGEVR